MFDTLREVLIVAGAAAGVVGAGVPLIVGFIKRTKKWVKERDWNKVMTVLPGLIIEAERYPNYTGLEKKEFVKSRLAMFSAKNKIRFDENKFNTAIDGIVRLTKQVNYKGY